MIDKSGLMSKFNLISYILVSVFLGCSDADSSVNEDFFDTNIKNEVLVSVQEVFETLPTPIETSALITKTDVMFDGEILNPVKNVPYYETSKSLALNLGIYCADMSYLSYYDQKKLTLEYLSAIKTLADNLGVIEVMNKEDVIKLEDNVMNQDSLRSILTNVFFSSGKYLNENNRPEMALLVQVGGWIEGMYIAMQLATQSININKELVDRIVEQRESLNLVLKSLRTYSEYPEINNVYNDLMGLQKIYNETQVLETDSMAANSNNFSNETKAKVTPEIFISLFKKVIEIRNNYTQ